ncbi:MAG: response regulator, partial [Pseudomonadales bacterium]|nr:response regulator [Pseudomonadales bacterium]
MPIMDGVEATKKIRYLETQNGRRTAIVALTAHALAEQRQHMMTVGMNDFLSKPVSEEQLLHTIEKWCAREQHPIKAPATVPAFTPASTEAALGSGEPCVDRRAALQACGNRADAAREMLKILFSTLEQDSVAIQHSIDSGDMALAQQQIHKLHGACCYCGVTDLKTCCNAMETLIKKDMTEYLADVTPHFHAAVAALLAWKKQHDIATFFH